jgi:hypothetical protein
MEAREIMLNENADITTFTELMSYLIGRINELVPEYEELEDNDHFKDYLGGLIAAFENVLVTIGYPVDKLPDYEVML